MLYRERERERERERKRGVLKSNGTYMLRCMSLSNTSVLCLNLVACVCPFTFAGKKQFIAEAVCKKFMYQLVKAVDHMHR